MASGLRSGEDWSQDELKLIVATLATSGPEGLAALSHDRVGGERYDRGWPGRAAQTMW